MGIKQLFIFIFCFGCLADPMQAQVNPENTIVHKIDGKKYYLHTVQKGNTLYSISKAYAIEIEDIVAENPDAEKGISINQVLKIPVKKVDKKEFENNQVSVAGEFILHQVQPKETIYLLSRKYSVQVNEIIEANPEIKEGLKIGSTVKIPSVKTGENVALARQAAAPDSLVTHIVQPKETLYSIAKSYEVSIDSILKINTTMPNGLSIGQQLRIPKFTEEYQQNKKAKKVSEERKIVPTKVVWQLDTTVFDDTFNILVMLPFFLDMNDTISKNLKENEMPSIFNKSQVALDFYKGILFALDSLTNLKYQYKVEFFDTQNDTFRVKQKINEPQFSSTDLVIGPLYRTCFSLVSEKCKIHNIHQVTPVSLSNRVLLGNHHVSKIVPSVPSHIKQITQYVLDTNDTAQVILINSQKLKDYELFKYAKRQIKNFELRHYDSLKLDTIKTHSFSYLDSNKIKSVFLDSGHYKLIVPSTDQVFVTELLAKLIKSSSRCTIEIFGLEPWMGFDNIDFEYFESLNVHVTQFNYVDFKLDSNLALIKSYRSRFFTEPTNFALTGFKMTMFYLSALDQYGKRFPEFYNTLYQNYPELDLNFMQTGIESGYENEYVSILKYHQYQVQKVNK